MKKIILICISLFLLGITGCGSDKKTLECKQNNEISTITIEKGKITKSSINGDEEAVTSEEWETLKNFYEFSGDETSEDIANKLKTLNESIGYTCTIK